MAIRAITAVGLAAFGLMGCGDAGAPTGGATENARPATTQLGQITAPTPSVMRTFGNWTAVCDNGNDCWAYATAADANSGWIILKYPAGPSAQVEIKVGDWSDTPGPLTLSVDDQVIRASSTQVPNNSDGAMINRFDDLPDFIAKLVQGKTLGIDSANPDNAPLISLQGAAAALLWIDERQGRLGTTTALVRRGDRSASTVPSAPALPVVRAAPAVSQAGLTDQPTLPASLEAMDAVKACRADMDRGNGTEPQMDDGLARLSDDTLLWSVLCFRGAYNEGHRFFLTGNEGQNPRPLFLRSTEQQGEDVGVADDFILINAGYDPDSRTISSFAKGRGLGDCGAAYVWTWTGRDFVLTEEQVMANCAGMWPDLWPTTWRSQEK
jgi:hypothetical protein